VFALMVALSKKFSVRVRAPSHQTNVSAKKAYPLLIEENADKKDRTASAAIYSRHACSFAAGRANGVGSSQCEERWG